MLSDSALHMPLISIEVLQLTCRPLLWKCTPKVQKSANVNFFSINVSGKVQRLTFVHKHIIFIDGTVVLEADVHTQVCVPRCDVAVVEYLV